MLYRPHASRLAALALATSTLTGLIAVVAAPDAAAYCSTGIYNTYKRANVSMATGRSNAEYTAMENAAAGWNNKANWSIFAARPNFVGPPTSPWTMQYFISFRAYGLSDIPGYTPPHTTGSGTMDSSTMYLNSDWSWNTNGTMSQSGRNVDVWTIVMHEMGHIVALTHPSLCHTPTTTETNAVMQPVFVQKHALNSDDIAGLRYMMGT